LGRSRLGQKCVSSAAAAHARAPRCGLTRVQVNLERAALLTGGRNSGHYVQGHVDGVGRVVKTWVEGDSLWYRIGLDQAHLKFLAPKGFVAVEGTSLTVCDVDRKECWFTLMLIDHTQKHVVLPLRKQGDDVNIEVDVMAKFAEQSLGGIVEKMQLEISALEARVKALEAKL
jgi:riboflavin synthase